MSKAQKGMSELLQQACAEAWKGNSSIIVEISTQEAVFLILQIPMWKASRQIVFINTAPPDKRIELLQPSSDINERWLWIFK